MTPNLWLRDASYLRLKNVEVGYSFSKRLWKKCIWAACVYMLQVIICLRLTSWV